MFLPLKPAGSQMPRLFPPPPSSVERLFRTAKLAPSRLTVNRTFWKRNHGGGTNFKRNGSELCTTIVQIARKLRAILQTIGNEPVPSSIPHLSFSVAALPRCVHRASVVNWNASPAGRQPQPHRAGSLQFGCAFRRWRFSKPQMRGAHQFWAGLIGTGLSPVIRQAKTAAAGRPLQRNTPAEPLTGL